MKEMGVGMFGEGVGEGGREREEGYREGDCYQGLLESRSEFFLPI